MSASTAGERAPDSTTATTEPDRPLRLAFVMEQHLGHRTYAENLRSSLADDSTLETHWVPVTYASTSAWWERIPVESVRAAWRGRAEVQKGLAAVHERIDACIYNTQVPAVLGGRTARRRPYVVCMDDTPELMNAMADGYEHPPDSGPTGWLKYRWSRHVLRHAAGLAPWSHWVRSSLIDDYGVDPSKIEVIPPGVNMSSWDPTRHDDDGPLRILFVGGDFERKGGNVLLKAFRSLEPGTAVLRLVTRSPVATEPGVEVYNGLSQNDPELRDLFETSDVFVLPSGSEMFGIAAVEAAAAGLPLVVTAVGGLAELVVDGVTGFSIQPDDDVALVAHLRSLAEQPSLRRTMGTAARRRAEQEFDADVNAARLVALARRSATLV